MANPRTLRRLESRIRERAAYCLQFEVKDPRAALLTVTRVELAADLSRGTIFYSCFGSEADLEKSARMLDSASGFIQRQVARVLETRIVPHLSWRFDESIARAAEIDKLITEARTRDESIRPALESEAEEE